MCSLLAQKYRTSWPEVAAVIRTEVGAKCASLMDPFFGEAYHNNSFNFRNTVLIIFRYTPGNTNLQLDRLAKLLPRHRGAQAALVDLRALARLLAAAGVLPRVFVDLSLIYHPGYYDGLLYQAILTSKLRGKGFGEGGEVVMAGGRYDGLVRTFIQEGTEGGSGNAPHAVGATGVNIAVEKIVAGNKFRTNVLIFVILMLSFRRYCI